VTGKYGKFRVPSSGFRVPNIFGGYLNLELGTRNFPPWTQDFSGIHNLRLWIVLVLILESGLIEDEDASPAARAPKENVGAVSSC
jgi:hypothetical protein